MKMLTMSLPGSPRLSSNDDATRDRAVDRVWCGGSSGSRGISRDASEEFRSADVIAVRARTVGIAFALTRADNSLRASRLAHATAPPLKGNERNAPGTLVAPHLSIWLLQRCVAAQGGVMSVAALDLMTIGGSVSPGFEAVREAFADNFMRRGELGGACCAYRLGEKVVDLWGGIRRKDTGEQWEQDTMVLVWSASKGLAAMTLAVAHSRGWLDYEERVAAYWPEFAQQGKEKITVRQLLAHQAGLFAFDEPVDQTVVADLDRLAVVLARQRPAWEPGRRQAYHAISLGFYEGELIRRIDPRHRSLGQFFQDEIATALAADVYIRLPENIPNSRLASLEPPSSLDMLRMPPRLILDSLNHRSVVYRALLSNPGCAFVRDKNRVYIRNVEVPSGGVVANARGIARAYGVFASGGRELCLRRATLDLLAAPAVAPASGVFHDDFFRGDVQFSLGFFKPGGVLRFGGPHSFGAPGSGGSIGFADPDAGVGYAYVTSQMGTALTGDPRDVALRDALYAALRHS
jgi:CubicO group peptidase (beta-lactamase class C family)